MALVGMPFSTFADSAFDLSDLRGKSFDATVTVLETNRNLGSRDSSFRTYRIDFYFQVYVSNAGRIFDRLGYKNAFSTAHYDTVTEENNQQLKFEKNLGFRRSNYDGAEKSTYVMITIISVRRSGEVYRCNAQMIHARGVGETRFIRRDSDNGQLHEIKSWIISSTSCKVIDGNVFASGT
jgi:hypothetical protein